MNADDGRPFAVERDQIIDHIYQIALEPSALDDFIDFWNAVGLKHHFAASGQPSDFGDAPEAFRAHLQRAQALLAQANPDAVQYDDYLIPFQNLAAFVLGPSSVVEASNPGASEAFDARVGAKLDDLALPPDLIAAVLEQARAGRSESLLRSDVADKGGALLLRVIPLAGASGTLVVSNRFLWRAATGHLLRDVFGLTSAEQDIVRALVEGQDAKAVATRRQTSEGTVRAQIKSVTAKMNLRSQIEIVRYVVGLAEFPQTDPQDDEAKPVAPLAITDTWLDREVWKPFRSLDLPDGRGLTFHDMGPLTGNPVLLSHMGSCMVRWPRPMVRQAFERNLRVICPIRAGYGQSDNLAAAANPIAAATQDSLDLLDHLGLGPLPIVSQGTDMPLALDLIARHPDRATALIGVGARPCLPGGEHIEGSGRWQKFFVSAARSAPHLAEFASQAVMAMCKRLGAEAMLKQLCKESPADLALLDDPLVRDVLVANLNLMAGRGTNAARAFAQEFIAIHEDWSAAAMATHSLPVTLFLAEQDPTIDLSRLSLLEAHYPWMEFKVVEDAGLALLYQAPDLLIPAMADAAKRAVQPST